MKLSTSQTKCLRTKGSIPESWTSLDVVGYSFCYLLQCKILLLPQPMVTYITSKSF